ncbi:homoserine kinase [Isoptericola sp. CG 20/1183]|uniref:Homoserine kinase n=1 Tax=Isoptericola halotolerans TaxID=300560 RepID=A0ABX5ECS0_9MICO|nr:MULTISPECIES: homoserine kinase [Isoptericola]MCK0116150.1 homoserine kinase [Isoptericola sp. S6320L]PRZ04867.1 homoserine kinase [Isoptericola halotolerans]PRZ05358.1 homoserine kinase [Isoptericola sp. CG 20/1183]
MRLGADHVLVRVPATSANLGPGFDAMGLALGLYDEIEVQLVASDEVRVDVAGEGAGEVPGGADHLVVRALQHTLELAGAPLTGVHLRCTNRIPHGRGLGSSAAAVVSGIVAARGLLADPQALDARTMLGVATEFEGHPDNAAPALRGGATLAWSGADGPRAVDLEVDPRIRATVLVPDVRLATSRARGVLPGHVPHADAAFTAGRAALLVEALARRPELLLDATEDRLHQEYRAGVMAGTAELVRSLRAAGLAATVSGAGPTVLVLTTADAGPELESALRDLLGDPRGGAGWHVGHPAIDTSGTTCRSLPHE